MTSLGVEQEQQPLGTRAVKKMTLVGVKLGSGVSKSIASACLSETLTTMTVLSALAESASVTTQAQLEALGAVAMRIPLSNPTRMQKFCGFVAQFAKSTDSSLTEICAMSTTQKIANVGIKANIPGIVASAAVSQVVSVAFFCFGRSTQTQLIKDSVNIALSSATSVAGGASGAVIGTLLLPGAGTAFGSMIGSFTGAFLPYFCLSSSSKDQTPTNPLFDDCDVAIAASSTRFCDEDCDAAASEQDATGKEGSSSNVFRIKDMDNAEWLEIVKSGKSNSTSVVALLPPPPSSSSSRRLHSSTVQFDGDDDAQQINEEMKAKQHLDHQPEEKEIDDNTIVTSTRFTTEESEIAETDLILYFAPCEESDEKTEEKEKEDEEGKDDV